MPISFSPSGLIGNIANPTSLQFGPDGRLYVAQQNGVIWALTVEKQGGEWVEVEREELTLPGGGGVVKSIQNHNDNGSESANVNRQVTGIVVTQNSDGHIILYVSSSDPRISTNNDVGLDTNSGVVSKVTQTQDGWDVVDLVRGLPRSEENHSVNGMLLSEDGSKLLLQVGGFTNNGAASAFFSYTNEYVLSGTALELDLVALEDLPDQIDPEGGQQNTPRTYKYDLPTLDDPNIENAPAGLSDDEALAQGFRENSQGMDLDGPHGGNDGLNMAILPADAPLRLYADGLRNAYDLARGADGLIYTVDNGANANLGGVPNTENGDDDGDGVPNEAIGTPNNGGPGEGEPFHQIVEGGYYYHPAPVRSNQNMAWTVYGNDGQPDPFVNVNFVPDISALVPAQLINDGLMTPGFLIDPSKFSVAPGVTLADLSSQEQAERLFLSGVFINSNQLDDPSFPDPDGDGPGQKTIAQLGSSTNGIIVYDSGGIAFNGSIDGAVFVTQFNDNLTLLNVNDAGTDLEPIFAEGADSIFGTADDVVQDADGILQVANNSTGVPLGNPLDVTQGPDGTLWVAEIGSNRISVLEPSLVSDPTNIDADSDGIENKDDPFSRDATNGTSVTISSAAPVVWEFSQGAGDTTPGPDGFGGGLTGAMINGEIDFEAFYLEENPDDPPNLRLDNVKFVTAAGGGTTTIEEVANGSPVGNQNDAAFLFHTGFVLAQTVDTFTVTWIVANPGAIAGGSDITRPEQQIGGYLGDGTQSNYIKIVAVQTSSGPKIRLVLEEAVGTVPPAGFFPVFEDQVLQTVELDADGIFDNESLVQDSTISLQLLVDLTVKTATPQATFQTTSGPVTILGGPDHIIDLAPGGRDSVVLQTFQGNREIALGEQQGIAAGLFSSNTGPGDLVDSFQAVFDSITVTATEVNVAPDASDDTALTSVGAALQIPVTTLLANDTDANSADTLTVTGVSNPQNGTVALAEGIVTFTPADGYVGEASFDYTVSDGALSDTATVVITVVNEVIVYRINAGSGGTAATNSSPGAGTIAAIDGGPDWIGDATLINSTGPVSLTGATSNVYTNSLTDAENEVEFFSGPDAANPTIAPWELFVNERSDNVNDDTKLTYNFDVIPGADYKISLFYTENWNNIFGFTSGTTGGKPAGQSRQFDVEVEGIIPGEFAGINPLAESTVLVGGTPPSTNTASDSEKQPYLGVALQRDYVLTAGDDTLTIAFNHDVQNPKVNAIQIAQVGGPTSPPDPTPVLSILNPNQTVVEGETAFISLATDITVPAGEQVSFTYVISGVTATPEIDYSPDDSLNGAGTATFTGNGIILSGNSDFQIPVNTLPDGLVEGDETFTVILTDISPNATLGASQAIVTIADEDLAPGAILFRVNAGGPEVADPDGGPAWSADQASLEANAFSAAVAGPTSPFLVDRGIDGIGGANSDNVTYGDTTPVGPGINTTGAPDALFLTERFSALGNPNNIGYAFDVANGDYIVNLYFDELFFSAPGARVFDVEIEGGLVLDDFDTFAVHGNDSGVHSFATTVTDGELNIEFLKTPSNNPHVAAIEIIASNVQVPTQVVVFLNEPTPASTQEAGDAGTTRLAFPVTFDQTASGPVTVEYSIDINGALNTGLSTTLGTDGGTITVNVPNDAVANGDETVTVTLTGVTEGDATLGTAVFAVGIVTEDDTAPPYEPPLDDLFGIAEEIADIGAAPSGPVSLAEGSNVMSATQEGEGDGLNGVRDRDYFTVIVPDGFQLAGVVLKSYENENVTAPDAFLAFQQGQAVTVDPITGTNVSDLQGAIIYGPGEVGTDLLSTMRLGFNDPQTGINLPGFDETLTGEWTFWLNQGAGPSTATLDFIVAPLPSVVTLAIADAPTVLENGDIDPSVLEFQLTASDAAFSGDVTVTYDAGAATGLTQLVTFAAGSGTLNVEVPSDDIDNGDDTVPVTLSGADDGGTTDFTIDAAAGTATGVVTEDDGIVLPPAIGSAKLEVNVASNNVQISNFGNNSFQLTNTGSKNISRVEIDVTSALYPDTVFDPFGLAGDSATKPLQIDTPGNTGIIAPDNGTASNPGSAYILGNGGIEGYEGFQLLFDEAIDGGFQPGEVLGFSVDMDPNSIAGSQKSILDSGSVPTWDVGGVSGAELIGSSFTVTFSDGTQATGQLQGANNQAGSKGQARQNSPNAQVSLSVNGLAPGNAGLYDNIAPSVIVNGPAGQTARVVLTKGIIQPVNNNFTGSYALQLDAQLAALEASGFPANNAAEFQTVDVLLTGTDQDITDNFDFTQVPGFNLAVVESQLPLGFVASIIDPSNEDLPLGPVTAPIYLQYEEDPIIGGPFSFSLVDTSSDTIVSPLFDGADITLGSDTPSTERSIIADYVGDGVAGDDDGSIVFNLFDAEGNLIRAQTESVLPFALYGDSNGDYNPPNPPLVDGSYSLTASAYDANGGSGSLLATQTISFTLAS